MRTASVAAALAALALLPASAAAKEITKVEVCGADACAAVTGGPRALEHAASAGLASREPARGRFYTVRATVAVPESEGGEDLHFRFLWVPGARVLRIGGGAGGGPVEWVSVPAATRRVLERTSAGLRPYPAARLRALASRLPEPRVDEVYTVAPEPQPAAATGGDTPWGWIAAGVVALAGAGALLLVLRRRQASSNTSVALTPP